MKILKTFKGEPGSTQVTIEQAIECLEKRGYYNRGTVDKILEAKENTTLQTDWAYCKFEF